MTDKKLTDEEIIKRLERCVKRANRNYDTDIVLDLIVRQKVEIEWLLQKLQQAKSEKESADNGGCGEDFVYVSDIDILVKEMTEGE
jgi:hypothetical protein